MSRAGNIIVAILMWCVIVAYVVTASLNARQRRSAVTVGALRIATPDTTGVVTAEKVVRWLAEEGIDPIGLPVDSVGGRFIESRIAARPEVKHVSVRADLSGTLTVRVEARTPAMRVRTAGGYRFWFTGDGVIIPDTGEFTAYVPVVTGSIPFPFGPLTSGSYARIASDSYNDYLERFTALRVERSSLGEQAAAVRAGIRGIRSSAPKRWWSAGRKKTFNEDRAVRLAELEERRVKISAEIAKIDGIEREIREKEKKSHESHRFLFKLANFVKFIERNDFWAAQIVQIDVTDGGHRGGGSDERGDGEGRSGSNRGGDGSGGDGSGGGGWREPQLELIPRAGDHTIVLGELDGTERTRLEDLRLFYEKGLWHEGWSEYAHINIKYRNQIVCTK